MARITIIWAAGPTTSRRMDAYTPRLLAKAIKEAEVIAYKDLGSEAVMKLTVENFPAVVANDIYGRDLFEQGMKEYKRE